MNYFEPVRWRWSHYKHHGHTAFAEPLDFEIPIRKPSDLLFFFSRFIPFGSLVFIKKTLQFETIKHAMGITTEVMEHCIPKKERSKCRISARIHVGIWMLVIVSSFLYQTWLPMLYILLPKIYGNTLQVLLGLTQHTGLYESIKDHRYSTRTVYLNPIFSFYYWQMEYHIEHHMFPNVPSYNLPKLHQMIKDQMPPAKKGLWDAYSEIIPVVIKQTKNPDYKILVNIPHT